MRHRSFGDFMDKKKRESIHQLRLVKQLLEHAGMRVDNFLESEDDHQPYIFCHNPSKNGSFNGVRIYKIGNELAFRIQKESKTHPYGSAYPLPIEAMFNDFLSDDNVNEEKAGKKVIESVSKEIRRFFQKCEEAEKEDRNQGYEGMGNIILKTTGTDYSDTLLNRT